MYLESLDNERLSAIKNEARDFCYYMVNAEESKEIFSDEVTNELMEIFDDQFDNLFDIRIGSITNEMDEYASDSTTMIDMLNFMEKRNEEDLHITLKMDDPEALEIEMEDFALALITVGIRNGIKKDIVYLIKSLIESEEEE